MMQLGCVLHMVQDWKKNTMVRVFMCVNSKNKECGLFRAQWEQTLHMLRIKASINAVFLDYHLQTIDDIYYIQSNSQSLSSSNLENVCNQPSLINCDSSEVTKRNVDFKVTENYLIEVNQMIRDHCDKTAVVFMYLPPPSLSDNEVDKQYLHQLSLLTNELPPTLLVYGISPVISTTW